MNLRKHIATPLLLLAALLFSCSREQTASPNQEKVAVSISAGQGSTRTQIDENGLSVRWSENDRIAVWAASAENGFAFSAIPFSAYYLLGSSARFTAEITPMASGSYTYYSVYPVPESVSGNIAYFTLPAVQNGSYDGNNDILTAYPQAGGALNDPATEVDMTFKHKMHALRIFVPEGGNTLGEPIKRIQITFPQDVAGRVGVDFTDPAAAPTLESGSRTITLNIPDGLDESADAARQYAYAIIYPAQMEQAGEITFVARSFRYQASATYSARTMNEGGSTPVRLILGEPKDMTTTLRLSIAENHLGEEPQKITFEIASPDDATFGATRSFTIDVPTELTPAGYYDLDITGYENLSGATVRITYESESAIVSQNITMPEIIEAQTNTMALTVPYLFAEDFSSLSGSFENSTEFATSDPTDPDAVWLDQYGLPQWSGARIGGAAGTGIRICSHIEIGLWIKNIRNGRVDTAPLTVIKEGKSVRLHVEFDYASDLYEGTGSGGSTTYWAGTTTNSGLLNGSNEIENVVLGETTIPRDGPGNNGTWYGSTPHTQSYEVDGCGSTTRLSWRVGVSRGSSIGGNGNYWLYIDNIKVSIVK